MKVIIYIIFMFFSAQSYSGEIDGKNIICNWDYDEYINKTIDTKFGYRFLNGKVQKIFIRKNLEKGGFYEIIEDKHLEDYSTDENNVEWSIISLNRKTLMATYSVISLRKNGECETVSIEIQTNRLQRRLNKLNEALKKAREGNKI
jgi:hypothetical protein